MVLRRVAVVSLLLVASLAQAQEPPPLPKAEVVIIGVDGVSLNLLLPMIEKGVTPVLGDLVKRGTSGPLTSIWPLRTPQVWTSMVTGKYPGQHSVWDHSSHTYFNPPPFRTKKKKRITSKDRTSQALWKLLDDKSIKTLTVGWIATWPAEKLKHGQMVAPIELFGDKRQTSIKPSFYRGTTETVWPVKFQSQVESRYSLPTKITDKDLESFADIPKRKSPLYRLPKLKRYVYGLRWSLARAQTVEKLTTELFEETPADVVFSYFQCTDSLLHRFWIFQESEEAIARRLKGHGISAKHVRELKQRFGGVVEGCYRDIDQRIGRILDKVAGPDTLVLLTSDHGFGPADVPHEMKSEPYSGNHLEDGFLVASGPGIKWGGKLTSASVLDITPTILHFLGQPVANDMQGKVLLELFEPGFLSAPKNIPTYEKKPQLEILFKEGWPPRGVKTLSGLKKLEKAQGY